MESEESDKASDNVRPEDSVSCAPAPPAPLDAARLRDVEKRLRSSVDGRSGVTPASSPPGEATGVGPSSSSSSHRSAPKHAESSQAPGAAGPGGSSVAPAPTAAQQPGSTLSGAEEVPRPLGEIHSDIDVLTQGLQKAIAVVRAHENSLNGQLVEYAQRMESKADVVLRSEQRLGEELRQVTKELFEVQVTLKASHSELAGRRASSAAEMESRDALMQELAKVNEAVASNTRERRGLEDELRQGRDELSGRRAELQQARDELRACSEGASAARLREEELEERLAGLQEAERTLQAELRETQAALQGQLGVARAKLEDAHAELAAVREELSRSERGLRGELAQVQAELGAAKAELQWRQKCCFRLRSKKGAAPKEVQAVMDC